MSCWSNPVLNDIINDEIWASSRAMQQDVRARLGTDRADILQARLGRGLPWVPDILGSGWREPGAVFVVGSAYSPFIQGFAGRSRSMGFEDYRGAVTAGDFLCEFVARVVTGDPNYYLPLDGLLQRSRAPATCVVLTDLVRACFVRATDNAGGDGTVKADPGLFMAYARAGWPWTWRRLVESEGSAIVALGSIAEHGFLQLLVGQGLRVEVHGSAGTRFGSPGRSPVGYAKAGCDLAFWRERRTWWTVEGKVNGRMRRWSLLPVAHPSARPGADDPGYVVTSGVLTEMMELS